jgi:hypothetical protein
VGVVAVAVATARCRWVATITEFKPELNNLPFIERRLLHMVIVIASNYFSLFNKLTQFLTHQATTA